MAAPPRIAVFGPNPLLSITIEARAAGRDDVHLHAGGQGVWASRVAGELGTRAVLCGFIGGETGAVLGPLLEHAVGEARLVSSAAASGCYVIDRRRGERVLISQATSDPPSRHELDDLFSITCTTALDADALLICNPYPGDTLPLELYGNLASDVGANGTPVFADLSSPRLDSVLEGRPAVVKVNDWELAEFVVGPVDTPESLREAATRLLDAGADSVIVTRGAEPALVLHDDEAHWLIPPRLERGAREGCGDAMMGALTASIAAGRPWDEALRLGAAAGAANFLRHGLGSPRGTTIQELLPSVELRPA